MGRMDGKVAFVTAEVDVRDFDALRAAVDSGGEQLGRLDVVVANAGIGTTAGKLHKTKEALWQEMIDVNLSGVWKSVKAGVPHVLAGERGGAVILTSSVAGNKAYPHVGHYVAAKHGVIGLMRAFAVELGQQMIRVNAVPFFASDEARYITGVALPVDAGSCLK
jgi:NAD(P)-dependent dehydrogenase (short-subunit alcohol dehydrogenase family)